MNHIHFHKTKLFLKEFLFDRYETIKEEKKPMFEAGLIVQEKVTTFSMLVGDNGITKAVSDMCKIIRVEPDNPYTIHRSIPSARNMFSNLIVLYVPFKGGTDIFQYDYISDDFIYVKYEAVPIVKNLTLALQYDHNNIGRLYGRFGFLLSLLDAGHQIHHIQETISVPAVLEYFPNDIRKYSEGTIASFTFPQMTFMSRYDSKIEKLSQKQQHNTSLDEDDIYTGFSEEISNDLITIRRAIEPKLNASYLKSCKLRTSFQSYQGLMFTGVDRECKAIDTPPNKEFLEGLSLVFVDCKNRKVYGGKDIPFDSLNIERLLHDSHKYVSMNDASMLVFAIMKRGDYSPKQIATSFVQTAEWINEISSQYANEHFITRCLRNIDDYYVKENLVDCEYVTYLLMVGDNDIDESLKGVV